MATDDPRPSSARSTSLSDRPARVSAIAPAHGAMKVKAQAFVNAVRWIEENHGTDKLGAIVRRCSPAVRDRYISGIAIEWHPIEEFVELLHAAEAVIGGKRGEVSKAMGAAGARINTRGMGKRAVFYLASPEFLLRRIASLWSQFNDRGEMRVVTIDAKGAVIALEGLPHPDELHCATITGWCEVIGEVVGFENARADHVECRARGAGSCRWSVRYAAVVGS